MKRLETALREAGMSLEEYDDLMERYARRGLTLFWSYGKRHWVVEKTGGAFTYIHFKTRDMSKLRQVERVASEFERQERRCKEDADAV